MSDDDSSQEGMEGRMRDGGVVPGGEDVVVDETAEDDDVPGSRPPVPPPTSSSSSSSSSGRKKTSSSSSSRPSTRRHPNVGGGGGRSSSSRTRPVVKLMVTSVGRSYSEPWRRRQQREGSGTGFLVRWGGGGGGAGSTTADPSSSSSSSSSSSVRIVTNAHVVRNASTVRARASFGPHVVNCEVEWLSLPLDLALLRIAEVDWDDFRRGWGVGGNGGGGGVAPPPPPPVAVGGGGGTPCAAAAPVAGGDAPPHGDGPAPPVGAAPIPPTPPPSSLPPLPFDPSSICLTLSPGLPRLDENVTCVGFPTGGTQISVTRGVVSRIDVDSHSVLRMQIDAAINPGNSGGPVFDERGHVVGVASAHLRSASNIGYIIPSKIVGVFLDMCAEGMEAGVEDRYCGLGSLVDAVEREGHGAWAEPRHVPGIPNLATVGSQSLESKALRRHLGLAELDIDGGIRIVGGASRGVAVVGERRAGPKEEEDDDDDGGGGLRGDDVLLAIDGCPIGMDGTIQLSPTRPDERINYRSLVTCRRVGSRVTLDVLRKKQRRELEVTLDQSRFLVSQYDDFDAIPLYVVVGGCVFSPLTLPLVQEKKTKSPSSFSRYYMDQRTGHEQLLVLSKVLNDDVNVGYHGWKNLILKSVNGYEPTNIQELVAALFRTIHSEMIEFRCQVVGQEDADYVICMDLNEVLNSEQRVLRQHMIASWCSTEAISKELREEVEKFEPLEAKRIVSWNTMKDMRAVLERKEGE